MSGLSPGFAPGFAGEHAAQAAFRAVLSALSRPGRVVALPPVPAPAGMSPAAAALLLALADAQVVVATESAAGQAWLAFHTGARFGAADMADFVHASHWPRLDALRWGSDAAPQDGATLLVEVSTFAPGPMFLLSGPGLERPVEQTLPVPQGFAAAWAAMRRAAPRGVDIWLCDGDEMMALPRSLTIEAL